MYYVDPSYQFSVTVLNYKVFGNINCRFGLLERGAAGVMGELHA